MDARTVLLRVWGMRGDVGRGEDAPPPLAVRLAVEAIVEQRKRPQRSISGLLLGDINSYLVKVGVKVGEYIYVLA